LSFEETFVGYSRLEVIHALYERVNPRFCDRARDALSVAVEFCSEPPDDKILFVSASGHCATDCEPQYISIGIRFEPRPK
jgi:hypothetical protein